MNHRFILAFAAALLPAAFTRAQENPVVTVRKDLAYYQGADADPKRHLLDLYLPEGKKAFPMLLFIHGGAWKSGAKDLYGPLGQNFARRGIGVAVANYRLSPAVQHPEHVKDVARAFAWLVRQAKDLGADPNRLFISGHSAGGHLVALLALDPRYLKAEGCSTDRIRGVVGLSGPYSLGPIGFADVFGEDEAKRADAAPLRHVGDLPADKLPPFLLIYADKDYAGLPGSAKLLDAALVRRGAKVQAEEIADRDHISIIVRTAQAGDPTAEKIIAFIGP